MVQNDVTDERQEAVPADRGFFSWVSSLGMTRHNGWVGGVCAAIASRAGVDPLVIRGVFVVATVLGFPALFLYAIGWALLPDEHGLIPLRLRGSVGPALVGILLTIVLGGFLAWIGTTVLEALVRMAYPGRFAWSMVQVVIVTFVLAVPVVAGLFIVRRRGRRQRPVATRRVFTVGGIVILVVVTLAVALVFLGVFFGFAVPVVSSFSNAYYSSSWVTGVLLIFTYVLVAAMLLAIGFWIVRLVADRVAAPASVGGFGGVSGTSADGGMVAIGPAIPPTSPSPPQAVEPVEPAAPADGEEFEAWRDQHEAWREQHDTWRAQQASGEKTARDEERARRRAQARAFAEESARVRAADRAARPRISFAFAAVAIGLALVIGGVVALVVAHGTGWDDERSRVLAATSVGLFTGAFVAAIGMIVAGIVRRRSGFLAFVAIVCLIAGGSTVVSGSGVFGLWSTSYYSVSSSLADDSGVVHIEQVGGYAGVYLYADTGLPEIDGVEIQRRVGTTVLDIDPGLTVRVRANVGAASVYEQLQQEEGSSVNQLRASSGGMVTWSHDGGAGAPTIDVDLTQERGQVYFNVLMGNG